MDGKIEPKIGEIITVDGVKYITQKASDGDCPKCALWKSYCWNIVCNVGSRKDRTPVIFKKVKTNMNEVKIQIPDNCELIKDGGTYIVKEKKQAPPRSWEEFCKKYPITAHDAAICGSSSIISAHYSVGTVRRVEEDKNWIVSKEEAEAFLALIQLRQLRKAWVGDWDPLSNRFFGVIFYDIYKKCINTNYGVIGAPGPLSFPTKEMTEEFLECFRDLCETAKILL